MSAARYVCCSERRRSKIAAGTPAAVSGIDYIEVVAGATTADPTFIEVVLIKPISPAPADLTSENIVIEGGVRFPPPSVSPAVVSEPGGGTVAKYMITIPGGQLTDFSTYRLSIVDGAGSDKPPSFLDPRLSSVDFSFKVSCPSDFDCAPDCTEAEGPEPPEVQFDYRLRDYQGFRRQMLDRLSALVPGFREDDPVDFTTTLVEVLAYHADCQSYELDWVGTEAFFSTARSRASIARHARLVDYRLGEGASARVFARFEIEDAPAAGFKVPAGTPLLVRMEDTRSVIPASEYRRLLASEPRVFETMALLRAWDWRNRIEIYTWSDQQCILRKGSTAATLVDGSDGDGPLAVGDLLLLEELMSPETGRTEDARPAHRHVVRLTVVAAARDELEGVDLFEVEWAKADALPFDLVIQSTDPELPGGSALESCAAAAANIIVAEHGASLPPSPALALPNEDVEALRPHLIPPVPEPGTPWRPIVDRNDIARTQGPIVPGMSASDMMLVDADRCLPAFWLEDDFASWEAARDLLDTSQFGRLFVIETEIGGRPALRFGDDINGLSPTIGTVMVPRGRFGTGPGGNIGAGALAHIVLRDADAATKLRVSNPLAGRGGASPESIEDARSAAPYAFRRQERSISAADYSDAAKQHPDVQNAVAVPRWTGAWQTMLVYVDRKGGSRVDRPFRRMLRNHIETYRLMGFDVAVEGAIVVPLELELMICAKPDQLRSRVAARVRQTLRPIGLPGSGNGFFHPDNFTFGSPLYLSQLLSAVMEVDGVQSVIPRKFQRLGRLPQSELEKGVIRPADLEVLQLDDDPSFPENGRLTIAMGGGR